MRFMVMHKMTEEMEKGLPPDPAIIEGVGKLIKEGLKDKVFVSGEGLKPSSQRVHIAYKNGKRTITDGPFTEAKELVGGFALMRVRSKEEAISWCDKFAAVIGDVELFMGPVVEPWDLGMVPKPANAPLRFLSMHKLDERSENETPPDPELMAKMGALIDEMTKAGVLQATGGLAGTKEGARIRYARRQAHRDRRAVRGVEGTRRRLRDRQSSVESRGDRVGDALRRRREGERDRGPADSGVVSRRLNAAKRIQEENMRKLIVSEFLSLDGVMQAPGGAEEDTEGGFKHGGWTIPFWHDDIGNAFGALMQNVDAFLLGQKDVRHSRERVRADEAWRSLRGHDEPPGEVRCIEKPRKADLAKHDDHSRQRRRGGSQAQGSARQEHPHRRQPPARAHAARARPGR